ncbi:MAG: hypothetical protein ACRDV4_04765 [Acidimicrobiales bacterium]
MSPRRDDRGKDDRGKDDRGRAGQPPETEPTASSADVDLGTLADLVCAYTGRRSGSEFGDSAQLVDAEVMVSGRPGIVDVVAEAGGKVLHLPVGLRVPGDEPRPLPEADDSVLGLFEDEQGVAMASEATADAELCSLLLHAVTGESADPALVRQLRMGTGAVTLAMDERLAFTVFTEVSPGPRLGLELLTALDEQGFNHMAAPVAFWRRGGRDLGLVQEYLAGASVGWALAMTSVRDLYASGGPPELAGGDFGAEARRLGTMTARMHLALADAFGRRDGEVGAWADSLEAVVAQLAPNLADRPEVAEVLAQLRSVSDPCRAIRTHGDFHLGRVYRNEQGWYVGDLDPGGRPSARAATVADSAEAEATGEDVPVFRSPVADVADMVWSFGHVATRAADERDPTGREGLLELAAAWENRNRQAFLSGYLQVPGMAELVPHDEGSVRVMASAFELERTAMRMAQNTQR